MGTPPPQWNRGVLALRHTHRFTHMDLSQSKLTKAEWLTVEVPVSDAEKQVLQLLQDGFGNIHIRRNDTPTLASVSKVEATPHMQDHLYHQYLEPTIRDLAKKHGILLRLTSTEATKQKMMKKCDLIRMKSMDGKIDEHRASIYEFVVLDFCRHVLESSNEVVNVYTLRHLQKIALAPSPKGGCGNVHADLLDFVKRVLDARPISPRQIVHHAYECIEKNPYLFKFADKTLFEHQKQLFHLFQNPEPKLVFYTAPTGTGKTLSPLGLSEGYRVIFICAARHVGLALAKSAVSMQKRIAVAFGCDTASDIRLHYFAASEYSRNRRSGGIGKVDNSVGDKVQIMICDVQSYLVAMHYMLAFSPDESCRDADLITYWDEPTITMDYPDHPLHTTIRRNWQENKISKLVLSCATLPFPREVGGVIADFQSRFLDATHHTICSYESSKSITLWNKSGKAVLPHLLFSDNLDKLRQCTRHCLEHRELLRYMDLSAIAQYIEHVQPNLDEALTVDSYFGDRDVTLHAIKEYYLTLLQYVNTTIAAAPLASAAAPLASDSSSSSSDGILLTTRDAHTLTDGPTIFLAQDVERVGRFLIQQSNIPVPVFQQVSEKIAQNSLIQRRMDDLQRVIEDRQVSESNREQNLAAAAPGTPGGAADKKTRDRDSAEMTRLLDQMQQMRSQIRNVCLDNAYIPNTVPHQRQWVKNKPPIPHAFVPSVDAESVRDIMALDVTDNLKLLLLLGIGMFINDAPHGKYVEIMKRLASEQRLFIILASSDYIYGTNYQFCHGFVGKDLTNMTYQKTIQAMGRIGRNHIQQEYTIRFRDDDMVMRLFCPAAADDINQEADKMNQLFSSSS